MEIEKKFKLLPNEGNHNCFACSSQNPYGLQMQFYAAPDAVFSRLKIPDHLGGWNNVVHGGVVSAMLDEVMSWAAMYLLKQFVLTKSMQIDFIKPVTLGEEIKAEGRVLEVQKKRDVLMQGVLYSCQGKVCAKSEGTFVRFSPKVARRLGIADESLLRDLEPIIT